MAKHSSNNRGSNKTGNSQSRNSKNPRREGKGIVSLNEEDFKRIITDAIKDALQKSQKVEDELQDSQKAEDELQESQKVEDELQDSQKIKENKKDEKASESWKCWIKKVAWFSLRFLFMPFLFYRDKKLEKNAHDQILVLIIELLLLVVGSVLWLGGLSLIVYSIICHEWFVIAIGLPVLMFGSLFFVAAVSFDKETDSMKIYAYSASILALASLVTSLIALYFATLG